MSTETLRPLPPPLGARWRRWRFPVGLGAALVALAVAVTFFSDQSSRGFLDPDGVNISGARALVRVLEEEGVTVTPVATTDAAIAADGGTVLVTEPGRLLPDQIDRLLATGAHLVLVEPPNVSDYVDGADVTNAADDEVLAPACDLPAAQRAGAARTGGLRFDVPAEADGCYPAGGSATLFSLPLDSGGSVTALGTSTPLTNRYLDQDGNAALALNLLGADPDLTWYRPTIESPGAAERSLADLAPSWVVPVLWQLVVAALIAAWWRARRLGPVVAERLPVVVRAAEAAEGRGRLYRRGRSRGHAAAVLRTASAQRMRRRFGMPATAPLASVIETAAVRSGLAQDAVADLLNGSEPTDDAALVRLADDLDALEREAR